MTAPSRSESSCANRPCASRSSSRIGSATRIQLSERPHLGRLEPRHELRDRALRPRPRRRSARASSRAARPTGTLGEPRLERRRAGSPSRATRRRTRAAARPRRARLVRRRGRRGVTMLAPRSFASRRTRAAAPSRRPAGVRAGATWTSWTCARRGPARRCAATPIAPLVVLGEEDAAAAMSSACRAHSSSHVSGSNPVGSGTSRSNSSQSSRSTASSASVARRIVHGVVAPRQQVVRREVLERIEAGGRARAHRHRRDRAALRSARSPAGHARGPREVPGEEPFGGPRAEAAQRGDRARAPRRRRARRARRGRGRSARAPTTYSALRREKPTATSSSSRAAAIRSRVGNAHASPTRSPKRSISRLRIANAAKSDTCCAVIEVTSASNGSGWSGGRKPREPLAIGASRLGPRPTRRTARARTARRAAGTTGRVSSSSGSTSTPPGAARDPHLASADRAVQPPSCKRFARSVPNARKRSVESSKSYGSGSSRRARGAR